MIYIAVVGNDLYCGCMQEVLCIHNNIIGLNQPKYTVDDQDSARPDLHSGDLE